MQPNLQYGKIIEEVGYRDGNATHRVRRTEESIAVHSRQELFDHILSQLSKLETSDAIAFTVMADRQTRQPSRVIIVNEEKL